MNLRNPYIPIDEENPTMKQEWQRNLTGEGREEREAVCEKFRKAFDRMVQKEFTREDEENLEELIKLLCADIESERRRVGGDWAVAGAWCLGQRKIDRDRLRSIVNLNEYLISICECFLENVWVQNW